MSNPKMHPSITVERVVEIVERSHMTLDNPGICCRSGEEQEGCEPDARDYTCEACGEAAVYGAEEILLMIA